MSDHVVVRTRSGALAMRSLAAGEVMHPGVGPLIEARELYVTQSRLGERLRQADTRTLVVFDVGLGAGSNAAAAFLESERAPRDAARLELISFERDLGALRTAMTAGAAFGLQGASARCARMLLDSRLTSDVAETPRTSWTLHRGDILEMLPCESRAADIVFWDPFSPRTNPALWTAAAFAAMRRAAGPCCTLFTYSASTAVRIAMLLAGWTVGVGDAIGTKAATTAAAVRLQDLARPLDRRWLSRLSRPDVPLPAPLPLGNSDAGSALDPDPARILRLVAAAPQFAVTPPGPGEIAPARGSR